MVLTKKQRRESGRRYNKFYDPEQGFYHCQYWDDWNDYRDGHRQANVDMTLRPVRFYQKDRWGKELADNGRKIRKMLYRRKRKLYK